MDLVQPPAHVVTQLIDIALAEDLGLAGDITSMAIFSASATTKATVVARESGVVAGIDIVRQVFAHIDPGLAIVVETEDGVEITAGASIATVSGSARSILSGERTALNLLGRLSGIATLTRAFVVAVQGTNATIADTRKTTPGLRALEKFAVRAGGGRNHRMRLDDAVMIKDNHVAAAGGVTNAVERVRAHTGHTVKIEVEVDTLEQLGELMELSRPIDIVLLDNMTPDQLRSAVALVAGRAITEASGGVTLETVRAIADTGVDVISVGALTHSATTLDVALDI